MKKEKVKEEITDDGICVVSRIRQASIKAAVKNQSLLGSGGYFDSQTTDTQIFGPRDNSISSVVSPPRKRGKFKLSTSPSPTLVKRLASPAHEKEDEEKKNTQSIIPEALGDLFDKGDDELEQQLEDAIVELGRLRQKADAKVIEINVLISHRLARMRRIFKATRDAKEVNNSALDSPPIQESQTWEDHGHLADEPCYPSLESQIYHTIVKDYEPLGAVRPSWLAGQM